MSQIKNFTIQFLTIALLITASTSLYSYINTHRLAYAGSLTISEEASKEYRGSLPAPEGTESGEEMFKNLVFGALKYVKVLVATIGILFLIILGMQILFAQGNEDEISTARNGIIYTIIAFALLSMSQDLAKIFDQSNGTLLESPQGILERVHLFDREVEILMTFIKIIIGSYATVMMVRYGVKLITSGADDDQVTTYRRGILYSGSGLLLLYIGDIAINKVFFKVNKEAYSGITGVEAGIDVKEGVAQMAGIANLIVKFMAPLALLVLIVGAIMYATSGGDEDKMEKAKRLLITSIIGIIIIYGAFALVNTVISSKLIDIGALSN